MNEIPAVTDSVKHHEDDVKITENATIVQVSERNSILIMGDENSNMAEEAVTSAMPMLAKLKRFCRVS